jgi:hypothetical protein
MDVEMIKAVGENIIAPIGVVIVSIAFLYFWFRA